MDIEEFRRQGYAFIDFIAAYREDIDHLPVRSRAEPGSIRRTLPSTPPDVGEGLDGLLDDFKSTVLPGLSHWQSPNFFGFFPANSDLSSVLGDLASSGLGVLGLSWQSSPALTEVEEVVCDWFRQMLGLPEIFTGVIGDSASTSTLIALLCARERASGFSMDGGGLQQCDAPLIVYATRYSHSSVEKAALLAGFGRAHLHWVAVDDSFEMDPASLRSAIEEDLAVGSIPAAVVATTGTTTTTGFDPIDAVGAIAQHYGAWFHVDAAMAGSAMILPEYRHHWMGIERADSIVVNAHKWLGVTFDCSLYLVRAPDHLISVMSTNPSYLRSTSDDEVTNLRDWGLPLGRRFRALKLWAFLRSEGVLSIQRRLRRDIDNARWLESQIASSDGWRVAAPRRLQTLCIRFEPPGMNLTELNTLNLAWVEALNASGNAYITPALLEDAWIARISIGSLETEREHVEALWAEIQRHARDTLRQSIPTDRRASSL